MYLLVGICLLCFIWRFWFKKRSILEPPVLSGKLPILGHALEWGDGLRFYKFIKRTSEECLTNESLVTFNIGPYKLYAIADPDDCLTVMNTCLQKHYVFDFFKPLLGNGLLTADVPTWKKHRKLLNPAFNQQVLNGFIDIFNTQALDLVDQFGTELGKPFDHEHLLRINNLNTICSTSLGVGTDDQIDLRNEYLIRLTKLIKGTNTRLMKFWQHSDFIYNMTSDKRAVYEVLDQTTALSKQIIQTKIFEKHNLPNTNIKADKFKSFIDLILDLADETGCFTDEQIREETENILSAGHDTTASTMTFVLTLLGSHTDVQEKAFEEIHNVLGNSDKHIDKDDLPKLVYVEAVLKETLRLYPIGPVLPRHIDKELKLKNYTVKANTDCFVLVYGLHRHSIWGPDADQFRPERWLDKNTLPEPKYYGGFGLGKRSCIGKMYALMSMKIILAHVLRKYRISSDISKMVVEIQLMFRPKSGHYITLTPRNISNGQGAC